MQTTVRPSPRWLYWLSVVLIGAPILWGLVWLHERVFGSAAGALIGWLYLGVAAALAALARFLVHLAWDALTMTPDPE